MATILQVQHDAAHCDRSASTDLQLSGVLMITYAFRLQRMHAQL